MIANTVIYSLLMCVITMVIELQMAAWNDTDCMGHFMGHKLSI